MGRAKSFVNLTTSNLADLDSLFRSNPTGKNLFIVTPTHLQYGKMSTLSNFPPRTNPSPAAPPKRAKSPPGRAGGALRLRKQPHRECKRKRFRNLNPKLSRALVCKNSSKRKRTLQCPPMKKLKTETAPTQTRVRQPEFSPTGSTFDRFLPHQISSQDWSLVADTLAECPDDEFIRIVTSPSFFV